MVSPFYLQDKRLQEVNNFFEGVGFFDLEFATGNYGKQYADNYMSCSRQIANL